MSSSAALKIGNELAGRYRVTELLGVALTAALLTEKSPQHGTLTPGQASAPLVRF